MLPYIPYMDPMGYVSICVNYVNWCPAFHAFHAFHCIPASHTMGRIWARNKDVAFKKSPMAGLKPSNRGRRMHPAWYFLCATDPAYLDPRPSQYMSISKGEARSNRSNWCNFQPLLVARLGSSLLHWCGVKHRTHDMPYIALHRGHCRARWSPMTS